MTIHTDLINVTNVRVLIDTTDVSAYVKAETLTIKDTGGIEVETCTFAMRPVSPAITLEWKECQVVVDLDDESSVYLFAGFVTRPVSAFADSGVETEIEVRAEGYKTLLARSKPFADYYKEVTVEAMVDSMLFDAELFDFTCGTQSEVVSYWDIAIDESIAKNLDRFCKERNWVWRVDWEKNITIGPESEDVFGDWGIAEAQHADTSALYPVENTTQESDASMVSNAVLIKGGMATSDIVTEEFTGDGTTENFFLSARPIGSIISIMVDELYVSWGTMGYHSCAERDCLVHFDSGYVRFCKAPSIGQAIEVKYTYQFPYTYTAYDSASQTLYGQTLWTLVEASGITDDTRAAAYAAAIFEQAATAPKRMTCDVRRIGPRAGQSIACRFPSLGVGTSSTSETMLIESIGTTMDGFYPVQTLRLGPATERLLGTLERMLGGGTSSANVASSSETSDHGLLTGLADDDHTQYLLATGTRAGASSQAQAFTNGIVGPTWRPASDGTAAMKFQNAAGTVDVVTVDTTNTRVGVGRIPSYTLDIHGKIGIRGAQVIYNAELESSFTGSLIVGNGGASLTAGGTDNGFYNTFVGIGAGFSSTTSRYNTVVGNNALYNNTTGFSNTAIGTLALFTNTTGQINVAVGREALYLNQSGGSNSAFGYAALYKNVSGSFNMAIGRQAMYENLAGTHNAAIGYQSLYYNTSGTYNLAIGTEALLANTTGSNNIALGSRAGRYQANGSTSLQTAANSVYIGANSRGFNNSDNNSTVIGYAAIGEGANTTVIGSTSTLSAALFGAGRFDLNDSATNGVSSLLTLRHNTSGTVDNGFGSRMLWELESSNSADQTAAALDVIWTEKTHASRTSKMAASIVQSGTLYELLGLGGSGAVFNDGGQSWADFRVAGDTATHLLFVDAGADAVGIGTSAPSSRFHVSQTTGDAGIREVVRVAHNSTGTPGKGFGVSLALALETTTTENMVAGLVAAIWNSATHASRAGDLIGYAADASGEREGWRVRASGSAPMFSLFGATPILRPTTSHAAASFTANSGTAVNDASTFDGYTLKQVVKALRDIGILT